MNIDSLLLLVGFVVAAIVTVVLVLAQVKKGLPELDDRIINNQKLLIEQNEKQIGVMRDQIDALTERVNTLSEENRYLRTLVSGSEFRKEIIEAVSKQHLATRKEVHAELMAFQKALLGGLLALGQDFREALDDHFPNGKPDDHRIKERPHEDR